MFGITVTHRLSKGTKQFLRELLQPPKPAVKLKEYRIVYNVKADQVDVPFDIRVEVTDSEGNPIPDQAVIDSLVIKVESDNPAAVEVIPDPADDAKGTLHFGSPGVAALKVSVELPDGTILGSGVEGFTVVTGDPRAITNLQINIPDLTPAPDPEP